MTLLSMTAAAIRVMSASFTHQALLAMMLSTTFVAAAAAEEGEYLLQPGDELSITLLGVSQAPYTSVIGSDGRIVFPYVGTIEAGGRTLEDLRREIAGTATGTEVPSPSGDQQRFVILTEDNLFLEVSRFRPIVVTGAVAEPGLVEFMPGMTVRSAVGAAGGIATPRSEAPLPPEVPPQLRALRESYKIVRSRLLQNEILLTEPDSPDDISEEHLAALSDLLGEGAVDPVLEEIDIAMRDYARQRAALRSQIELVDQRIETLRAAIANYTEASVAEEQRLSRMLEMADRGLAAADRVNDARIAALAASSRLLTVESDIFAARSERERLNVEMESLRDEHRGDLLIENRDLSREVAELSGRIEGLRALVLGTAPSAETGIETSIETFIYRGSGADEEFRLVEMGDTVRPGDVIEIRMILGVLSD